MKAVTKKTVRKQEVERIGMREFYRNVNKYRALTQAGKKFIITSHNEPVFEISKPTIPKKKQSRFEEMMEWRVDMGDPHLSQRVDEIVYGKK